MKVAFLLISVVTCLFHYAAPACGQDESQLIVQLSDQAAMIARQDSSQLPTSLAQLALPDAWLDPMGYPPRDSARYALWLSFELNRTFRLRWTNENTTAVAQRIVRDSDVLDFEIAHLEFNFTPNDWELEPVDLAAYDNMQVREAWAITRGSNEIILATVDTGYDIETSPEDPGNPDLINLWVNPCEDANHNGMFENWDFSDPPPGLPPGDLDGMDGIDGEPLEPECENGLADDVIGWDFVDVEVPSETPGEDYDTPDYMPGPDKAGHGSLVAGMAAAATNNSVGIVSPTWSVSFMPLRAGYASGITCAFLGVDESGVGYAIQYAADNGAHIISLSLTAASQGGCNWIRSRIGYAIANGCLVFVAAGNNNDTEVLCPNNMDEVISIAGVDETDHKATHSNYGTYIDLSAFGQCAWSTCSADACLYECDVIGSCGAWSEEHVVPSSGTSLAAPLAASVAALVWSFDPTMTDDDVKNLLFDTADPTADFLGQMGHGRVNALKALLRAPGLKTLQEDLVIPEGTGSVTIAGELRVPAGITLAIEPNVTVELLEGARIYVQNGGRITAIGGSTDHITFELAGNGTSAQIYLLGGTTALPNRFSYCDFTGAGVCAQSSGSAVTNFTGCTFDGFSLSIFGSGSSAITVVNCDITAGGTHGIVSFATLTMNGGSVQDAGNAGIYTAGVATARLQNVRVTDCGGGGGTDSWYFAGVRNVCSHLNMYYVRSTNNSGPGLSCLGGYANLGYNTLVSPPGYNSKSCIEDNASHGALPRTQIYLGPGADIDLCNGRNRIYGDDGALIVDANPNHSVWVKGNNWGGRQGDQGALPPLYFEGDITDPETMCDGRNMLTNYTRCLPTEPAEMFEEALTLEYDMFFNDAVVIYKAIITNYPDSPEAKLCPDRILYCEKYLTADWSLRRDYFLGIADTTHDADLEYECRVAAAWCLVEMEDYESAEADFVALLDEYDEYYPYHKTSILELIAELEAAGGGFGILSSGASPQEPTMEILDRMEALLSDGDVPHGTAVVPQNYALYQNYPNPFNPLTEIRFDLPEQADIELTIFNTLGQRVATLIDEPRVAGAYCVQWDGSAFASGVYLYQLKAGDFEQTMKMVLVK